jgi:uncharacterized repeat protein (TIGR02543 family)
MIRCKNCGSENDDNLYICQNCGSPLYDEDEQINDPNDTTQVFNAINDGNKTTSKNNTPNKNNNSDEENKKKQQTIAVIIILAVILVAIIIGIIVAVAHNSNNTEITTESTTISTTENTTLAQTTSRQTTTETTTKATTESTTQTTTTTTTAPTTFTVSLSCNDGGEVEGDGTYKRGDNVTIIARPDDGYDFDGWYNGSKKVSSNTKYTFTVTDNSNLEAVFVISNGDEVDIIDGETD